MSNSINGHQMSSFQQAAMNWHAIRINPDQVRFITAANANNQNHIIGGVSNLNNNNNNQQQQPQQQPHQVIIASPQQQQQIQLLQQQQQQQQQPAVAAAAVIQQHYQLQQQQQVTNNNFGQQQPQQQPRQHNYAVVQQQRQQQPSTSGTTPKQQQQQQKQQQPKTTTTSSSGGGPASYTAEIKEFLEEEFQTNPSATAQRRSELAQATGLTPSQIKNWFGDRRKKEYKRTGIRPTCAPNGIRRRFPPEQRRILELELNLNSELESQRVENISQTTGLTPKQIRTWFRDNRKKLNKEFP